jgi:hypothetical protein
MNDRFFGLRYYSRDGKISDKIAGGGETAYYQTIPIGYKIVSIYGKAAKIINSFGFILVKNIANSGQP